jgi:hypothetical protein
MPLAVGSGWHPAEARWRGQVKTAQLFLSSIAMPPVWVVTAEWRLNRGQPLLTEQLASL